MKSAHFLPLALCLALGACAAPTGPSVVAVTPASVTDANFARDAATCRAKAQAVTDVEAANGALFLQDHYDSIYGECMANKGYNVEARPHYYGPGPYAYGPGP